LNLASWFWKRCFWKVHCIFSQVQLPFIWTRIDGRFFTPQNKGWVSIALISFTAKMLSIYFIRNSAELFTLLGEGPNGLYPSSKNFVFIFFFIFLYLGLVAIVIYNPDRVNIHFGLGHTKPYLILC
jgi:hypothetical protein